MAKQNDGMRPAGRRVPLAVGVAGGAGVGFALARTVSGPGSAAVTRLVDLLVAQIALQTTGPIVATAITGSCSILSAIAIPLTVIWAIKKGKQNDS